VTPLRWPLLLALAATLAWLLWILLQGTGAGGLAWLGAGVLLALSAVVLAAAGLLRRGRSARLRLASGGALLLGALALWLCWGTLQFAMHSY
jgi:hypothetical protein